MPAVTAPVQRLDRKPTVPTSSRTTSEADRRFCGEQAQQLVVEGGARAGGRGQPVARVAHALRGARRRFAGDSSGELRSLGSLGMLMILMLAGLSAKVSQIR